MAPARSQIMHDVGEQDRRAAGRFGQRSLCRDAAILHGQAEIAAVERIEAVRRGGIAERQAAIDRERTLRKAPAAGEVAGRQRHRADPACAAA